MQSFDVNTSEKDSVEELQMRIKCRKPLLIKNWDIGPCINSWTCENVSSQVGNEPVKIHVSINDKMDFINKNFLYKTLAFDEVIKRIFRSVQDNYFIAPEEKYYLRSLGNDQRGKLVANFFTQHKNLARDLKVPPLYDPKDFFSSVFRASSKGIQLWTHYDIMDNLLIQVKGMKKIVLWPPSEMKYLYMCGDKSLVLDIENPNLNEYPKFKDAIRYECILNSGDVLFIPSLWFHNTLALEPSLGVNIFWRNLPHEFYDKSDTYGNKDLIPGNRALNAVNAAIKSLSILPKDYRDFYIQRIMKQVETHLIQDTKSDE